MKNLKYKKKYYSLLIAALLFVQNPNINAAAKLKTYDPELCMCEGQKIRTWRTLWILKNKLKNENSCGCQVDGMVGLYDNLVCDLIDDLKARNNDFLKDLLKERNLYKDQKVIETKVQNTVNKNEEQANSTNQEKSVQEVSNTEKQALKPENKVEQQEAIFESIRPLKLKGLQFDNFLLLDGEPGTGKTEIAERISEITGSNFFKLNGGSIVGPLFGEGSIKIENIFYDAIQKANQTGKVSIILLDEIQEIARKDVGSRNKEPHSAALETLKGLMSDYENDPRICVIATTNHFKDFEKSIKSRFENNDVKVKLPSAKVIKQFVEKFFEDNKIENIPAEVIDKITNQIQKTSIRAIKIGIKKGLKEYKASDFTYEIEKINSDLNKFAENIAKYIKACPNEEENKEDSWGKSAKNFSKEVGMFVVRDIGAKIVFEGVVFVLKQHPILEPVGKALEQWRPKTVIEKLVNNFGGSKSDSSGDKGSNVEPDSSAGA